MLPAHQYATCDKWHANGWLIEHRYLWRFERIVHGELDIKEENSSLIWWACRDTSLSWEHTHMSMCEPAIIRAQQTCTSLKLASSSLHAVHIHRIVAWLFYKQLTSGVVPGVTQNSTCCDKLGWIATHFPVQEWWRPIRRCCRLWGLLSSCWEGPGKSQPTLSGCAWQQMKGQLLWIWMSSSHRLSNWRKVDRQRLEYPQWGWLGCAPS